MSANTYRIRVEGHLDELEAGWFEGLQIVNEPNGETTLTGPVVDQAALHGLINRVFSLNLILVSVGRVEADRN
jgi:hypothetical protein